MPIIIIGGILSGIFTATESGAIACAYAIVIGGLVYRELKLKNMFALLVDCAKPRDRFWWLRPVQACLHG